jgi:hypothetical protein
MTNSSMAVQEMLSALAIAARRNRASHRLVERFFYREMVPPLEVRVNLRTGGASSPLINQGAFALAPGKEVPG